LQSATKKCKIDPDEPDVTVQTGMYATGMFAANLAVSYLINFIIVGGLVHLLGLIGLLQSLFQTM